MLEILVYYTCDIPQGDCLFTKGKTIYTKIQLNVQALRSEYKRSVQLKPLLSFNQV